MSDERAFKVLVAIDADVLDLEGAYSITSNSVFRRALVAANREDKAELHVLTVLGAGVGLPHEKDTVVAHVGGDLFKLATDEIATFTKNGAPPRISRVVTHVLTGSPAEEIVWLAASIGADLIVVGSHGRKGMERLLLGSVAEHVVRSAGCSVLVERGKHHDDTWVTPAIEPPCKECVAVRASSGGKQTWCTRHLEHHARAHTYADGTGDSAAQGVAAWGFSS